jgi:hypothetical protein
MSAGESPMSREHAANFARDGIAPSSGVARLRLRGRLNLFQTAMLRWRELHPYNAVHAVRVMQPLERARLETVIAERLGTAGLTGLVIDRSRQRYEYRGGPAVVELEVISGGDDGASVVRVEIERQLNRPFPADGPLVPFRFFASDESASFHLGLAYDHFVAGGDSIAILLNDIVHAYTGAPMEPARPDLYPAAFAPVVVRNASTLLRGLGALWNIVASCRHSVRPRYRDHQDGHNGFDYVTLAAPAAVALRAKARSLGVTFNDVLVALILKAVARDLPETRRAGRRGEIALTSIVNLRNECGLRERDAFGQFLSSMPVSHRVPDGISLEALAQDVHRQTARFKERKLYLQMLLAMRINGMIWWFLNDERRQRLYAKAFPMMAGLTTLNVDALWRSAASNDDPRDYLRAVPTGPVAPLVVAATTSCGGLAIGLSYRRSAFDPPHIAKIAAFIADSISAFQ